MRSTGNTKSNQKYNPANKPPPTTSFSGDTMEDLQLERYIRDKYERKSLMKKARLPPLPSPTFQGDPDKVNAILGPPARSPSLTSNSSGNPKSGQRISGDSFDRAKSPSSTNSSFDLPPPPKPPRPTYPTAATSITGNPFLDNSSAVSSAWKPSESQVPALPNPAPSQDLANAQFVYVTNPVDEWEPVVVSQPQQISSTNPFQPAHGFMPQLQPIPQAMPLSLEAVPTTSNPFNQNPNMRRTFSSMRSDSLPVPSSQPIWSAQSQPSSPNSPLPPSPFGNKPSLPQRSFSLPQSPNPFTSQSAPISPNNPFLSSQQPPSPFGIQFQSQAPPPQPVFQPVFQPVYQQSPQPSAQQPVYSSQPFAQSPFQQPNPQPVQPFGTTQSSLQPLYPPSRMDNQTILSLFNNPSAPSNPTVVPHPLPSWTQ